MQERAEALRKDRLGAERIKETNIYRWREDTLLSRGDHTTGGELKENSTVAACPS